MRDELAAKTEIPVSTRSLTLQDRKQICLFEESGAGTAYQGRQCYSHFHGAAQWALQGKGHYRQRQHCTVLMEQARLWQWLPSLALMEELLSSASRHSRAVSRCNWREFQLYAVVQAFKEFSGSNGLYFRSVTDANRPARK